MSLLDPALEKFISSYPTKAFRAGHTIVYQGEVPRSSYLVLRGTVRIYSLDMRGDESNISFISEGHLFPVEVIFEKTTSSLHYYEASADAEIVFIPTVEARHELATNKEVMKIVLDEIAAQYIGAKIHIQALEQTRAQDKILRILQYLVLRFGEQNAKGNYRISLKLKQHDIANMVGVARETAATELGKLKKSNVIDYDSFHFTVNMTELSKLIGSEEWEDIEIS